MSRIETNTALTRSFAAFSLLLTLSCAAPHTVGSVDVLLLLPVGGAGDVSIADGAISGVTYARSVSTFDILIATPTSYEDAKATFDEWADSTDGRRLIIVASGAFASFVDERDCRFGSANVLLLDASIPTCRNLRSVRYRSFAPAFLAGVAAVGDPSLNPGGTVGVIAGADIPSTRELVTGFTEASSSRAARLCGASSCPMTQP